VTVDRPTIDLGAARQFVRERLDGLPEEVVETAELLITALLTNAVVHGGGKGIVALTVSEERVRVEVSDPNRAVSLQPLPFDPIRAPGRGLTIVNALASSWGVRDRWPGKTVWFELALTSPSAQGLAPTKAKSG